MAVFIGGGEREEEGEEDGEEEGEEGEGREGEWEREEMCVRAEGAVEGFTEALVLLGR